MNYCSADKEFSNTDDTTQIPLPNCWSTSDNVDVWFTFKAVGQSMILKIYGGTASDLIKKPNVAIYDIVCSNLTLINCAKSMSDTATFPVANLIPGKDYIIRIGSSVVNQGKFKLCFTQFKNNGIPQPDFVNSIKLCDKSDQLIISLIGAGNNRSELGFNACINTELNSSWFQWTCAQSGTLTMDIIPVNLNADLDFVLYEINRRDTVSDPFFNPRKALRCTGTNCKYGAVGLNMIETDSSEAVGCNTTPPNASNSYLKYLNLQAGKTYLLMVDNTTDMSGYEIHFGGTATFGGTEAVITSSLRGACLNKTIKYDALSSVNYQTVKWVFDHGTPSTATGRGPIAVKYDTLGTYPVYLTLDAACQTGNYKDTLLITVDDKTPVIDTTSMVITNTINNNQKGAIKGIVVSGPSSPTYQWYKTPAIKVATTLDLVDVAAGVYYLVVSNGGGCMDTVGNYEIKDETVTSLKEVQTVYDLTISPNPTSGQIYIDFKSNSTDDIKIEIQNIIGQTLVKEYIKNSGKTIHQELDLGDQNAGIYFVKITQANSTTTKRIIRQ